MRGRTEGVDEPPLVDEGDPPRLWSLLARELTSTPGRLGNSLRLVALVVCTVAVSETFRLPETALSAYVVLFVSRAERGSTVMAALVAGVAVLLALLITIVVFMASLSQPALRLPLIALVTFVAMFAARASPLGPVLFAGGFIIAYGLTLGDEVLALSLQPGSVANTTALGLPELAFVPPEESLVYLLLWLGLAVAMPVALVIVANLLTGRDPALVLRMALAERLAAAAGVCADEPGASRTLTTLTRTGTTGLLTLQKAAHGKRARATDAALVDGVDRLCLVLLAMRRLPADFWPRETLHGTADACREAEDAVRNGTALPTAPPLAVGTPDVAQPLAETLSRALGAIRAALTSPFGEPAATKAKTALKSAHGLLSPDAFTNPGHVRFAFKVTLAMLLCYVGESLSDWPGIHTCIITCFFVPLGTVGETVHKATLRIAGCLVGAALGIATILVLMPLISDLGDLLLAVAAVTFLAGWIGSGSERIAYAGWQIGLAFYLTVLQGYGPTLDMETARDRIVGILVGNFVVFVIFTVIWPVSVGSVVRPALANAIEQLAALLDLQDRPYSEVEAAEPALRQAFGASVAQAREVLANDAYESRLIRSLDGRHAIDMTVLLDVQELMVPLSALLEVRTGPAAPQTPEPMVATYYDALAAWLRRCAIWIRSGIGATEVALALPEPPGLENPAAAGMGNEYCLAQVAWLTMLHRDILAILDHIGPRPTLTAALPAADAGFAEA